jgi:hypothetical protein
MCPKPGVPRYRPRYIVILSSQEKNLVLLALAVSRFPLAATASRVAPELVEASHPLPARQEASPTLRFHPDRSGETPSKTNPLRDRDYAPLSSRRQEGSPPRLQMGNEMFRAST